MKKIIATAAAVLLLTTTAYAQTNVYVNDKLVEYSDQAPVIVNERTYIPIRDVFEALGYTVDWNGEIKSVEISNDYYTTVLYTKTSGMFVSDAALKPVYSPLENEIKIINGRTMLPLREILESMGYALDWDAETKSTHISDKNDYTYLKEQKKITETVMNTDKIRPNFDDMTDDEKAYFEVLDSVCNIDTAAFFNGLTPQNTAEHIRKIDERKELLSAVPCPPRCKELNDKINAVFERIKTDVYTLSEIYAQNGNEEGSGLTPVLTVRFGIDKQMYEAAAPNA